MSQLGATLKGEKSLSCKSEKKRGKKMKIDFFRFSAEVEESIAIMILATANVECQNLVETL